MTFRLRLALATALAVAVTVAAASAVIYLVMRDHLQNTADQQLQQQSAQVLQDRHDLENAFQPKGGPFAPPQHGPSATSIYYQAVLDDGRARLPTTESQKVPVD